MDRDSRSSLRSLSVFFFLVRSAAEFWCTWFVSAGSIAQSPPLPPFPRPAFFFVAPVAKHQLIFHVKSWHDYASAFQRGPSLACDLLPHISNRSPCSTLFVPSFFPPPFLIRAPAGLPPPAISWNWDVVLPPSSFDFKLPHVPKQACC